MSDLRIRFQGQGAEDAARALAEAVEGMTGTTPRLVGFRGSLGERGTRDINLSIPTFFLDVTVVALMAAPKLEALVRSIWAKAKEISARSEVKASYEVNGRVLNLEAVTRDELLSVLLEKQNDR